MPSFGLAIKVTAAHTGHTLLYTLWFTDHTVSSSTSSTRASAPLCAPAGHVRARRTFLSVAERAITLKLCLKARVLNPSPFNTPLSQASLESTHPGTHHHDHHHSLHRAGTPAEAHPEQRKRWRLEEVRGGDIDGAATHNKQVDTRKRAGKRASREKNQDS